MPTEFPEEFFNWLNNCPIEYKFLNQFDDVEKGNSTTYQFFIPGYVKQETSI
jgi:hypothetical protein